MTSPTSSGAGRPDARTTWLLPYMGVQLKADRAINRALREAALDAEEATRGIAAKEGIGAAVRRAQLVGSRGAIGKIITQLFGEVHGIIKTGQSEAADAAIQAGMEWDHVILSAIESNPKKRKLLERSLQATADRNVQSMITRILKTEWTLSQSVISARSITQGQMNRLINSSLARGDSADDMAKKVKQFVDPSTPGGAAYAARRIGRTEINNAYHAQSIQQNEEKPWVADFEWHLSKSHNPHPGDACERYARQKIFPKDGVPKKPHPQCMCYIVPTVERLDVTIARARSGEFDSWFRSIAE